MQSLKLSENGRYLTYADGTPFFYMADTAWDLFYRLSPEEADHYFSVRRSQGFNAIQAILLGGVLGSDTVNVFGRKALNTDEDGVGILEQPDLEGEDNYWATVLQMVRLARQQELYMALLPGWLNKYYEPGLFSEEKALAYGRFLGAYFAQEPNIIWVMGGDYQHKKKDCTPLIHAIAKGIRQTDTGAHLMTFHPAGNALMDPQPQFTSAGYPGVEEYVDFHGAQSGHGLCGYQSYLLLRYLRQQSDKPYLDLEARYENHSVYWRCHQYRFDPADLRQVFYQNVLEGACGQTYGHASIFAFSIPPDDLGSYGFYLKDMPSPGWKEALYADGARQLGILKQLRLSRPYEEFRPAPELVESDDQVTLGHISAGRGEKYAFVYAPLGQSFKVHCAQLGGKLLRATWLDPRTGEQQQFAAVPPADTLFVPPSAGKGNDWLLILDVWPE